MAETVVALSSVTWQIWTRDTGPWRRIASITWKRFIARMSSGSAVFIDEVCLPNLSGANQSS